MNHKQLNVWIFSFLLLILPIFLWVIVIQFAYSILFSIPLTGERKILIESLQFNPKRVPLMEISGYKKGYDFEVIAPPKPGEPDGFYYIKTNNKTSEVNEPYFRTTVQKLYWKYGTEISRATRWERTTKYAELTLFGIVIFWGIFISVSTLCLVSYYPLLALILNLVMSTDIK